MPELHGEGVVVVRSVRPTTLDPAAPWHRSAIGAAVAIVAVLALSLLVAVVQDRSGHYPGHRSAQSIRSLTARVATPTNARVDGFERAGPLRSVGPYPWRVVHGSGWRASAGVAQAGPGGGVVVVDPHRTDLLAQADVFRPVPGAGLVFRWHDAANHFSVEVAPTRDAWLLVRTVGGRRTVLGRVAVNPQGSDVRIALTGSDVLLTVNGEVRVDDPGDRRLAGFTAVGLRAPTGETRFDEFALLAG